MERYAIFSRRKEDYLSGKPFTLHRVNLHTLDCAQRAIGDLCQHTYSSIVLGYEVDPRYPSRVSDAQIAELEKQAARRAQEIRERYS